MSAKTHYEGTMFVNRITEMPTTQELWLGAVGTVVVTLRGEQMAVRTGDCIRITLDVVTVDAEETPSGEVTT